MSRSRSNGPGGPHPYEVLLGGWSVGVALLVLLAAGIGGHLFAPERIGVELCWLRAASGLPCPGCGLTRSVSRLAAGDLGAALWFHPFGVLVLPWAAAATSSPLWPAALRQRLRRAMGRRRKAINFAYLVTVAVFLAYGAARLLAAPSGRWPLWS